MRDRVIVLATVVAALAVNAVIPRSQTTPLVAKTTAIEGVREARVDAGTFRIRWSPVSDLPPMKEIVQEPLLLVSHDAPLQTKQVSRRPLDTCQRHGMRKVMVGKYRWRCRR